MDGRVGSPHVKHLKKKPPPDNRRGLRIRCLAVTYSHMGRPHTTIGAEQFHFRVRKGIGWFPLAIAARQTGSHYVPGSMSRVLRIRKTALVSVSRS